jgi:polyisoprenoid-binding protein YceI
MMVRRVCSVSLAVLVALSAAAVAGERSVTLDPASSHVTFTLGTTFHEVHGTMAVTGGGIRFDPETGAASGEITVDARTAETGNHKRDKTMHADVLESESFPAIVFRAERVEGQLVDPGHSELRLVGVMRLHGADHPMSLPAAVDSADGRVGATLQFTVPYVEWGMHDPSFLIARAEKTVEVKIEATGTWAGPASAR